jgi:hypothetical protein
MSAANVLRKENLGDFISVEHVGDVPEVVFLFGQMVVGDKKKEKGC